MFIWYDKRKRGVKMEYVVVIKKNDDDSYKKIIGIRRNLKKAEELEKFMISRINENYYIDIEICYPK